MTEIAIAGVVATGFITKLKGLISQHPRVCAAIAALVVAAIVGAHFEGGMMAAKVAKANNKVAVAQASADQAHGQIAAAGAATTIAQAGAQRVQLDVITHAENASAIAKTAGADAGIPAAVNDAGRRGLCQYPIYAADPGCTGLRFADPAVVSQAGGTDSSPEL